MDFLARIAALILSWPLRALAQALDMSLPGQWRNMSAAKLEVARWAHERGKPHGFGETMRAIAWQESSFGFNLENPKDKGGGSYGIFGNCAKVVGRRFRREFPPYLREGYLLKMVANRLKVEREFAARACLEELRYWYQTHGEDWPRIWASYNTGWEWDSRDGRWYARQIAKKINFLRTV